MVVVVYFETLKSQTIELLKQELFILQLKMLYFPDYKQIVNTTETYLAFIIAYSLFEICKIPG